MLPPRDVEIRHIPRPRSVEDVRKRCRELSVDPNFEARVARARAMAGERDSDDCMPGVS